MLLVSEYGVNLPVFEDWVTIDLISEYRNNTLSFNELWKHHGEHRTLFPLILLVLLGLISDGNLKFIMFVDILFVFMIYLLLIFHIKKNKAIFWRDKLWAAEARQLL